MGTHLSIAGKHTFSKEFKNEKIISLAYSITELFIKKFNLYEEVRLLDNFEIHLNFQNLLLRFYIDCIGNGIWLYVYENAFIINSYYKFHDFVYGSKAGTSNNAVFFKDFRKNIFELMQIMNCNRVIYLCDEGSGRELSKYSNQIMEGVSFDKVEQQLINRYGKPITDLDKINSIDDPLTFYDKLNEFIVDDFKDFYKI